MIGDIDDIDDAPSTSIKTSKDIEKAALSSAADVQNQTKLGADFFAVPSENLKLDREGNFDVITDKELYYSVRSQKSVRLTLIVLVTGMFLVAALRICISFIDPRSNLASQGLQFDEISLLAFPIVIYVYFTWLYLAKKRYRLRVTRTDISCRRIGLTVKARHGEIFTALRTRPVLRDRRGIWLPTLGKHRILVAEEDTIPGQPFIEELLAFYGAKIPRDPYGTRRSTFTSLSLVFIFMAAPFFVYLGMTSSNPNAIYYSFWFSGTIALLGLVLLALGHNTTKAYKTGSDEGADDFYDDYIYSSKELNEIQPETEDVPLFLLKREDGQANNAPKPSSQDFSAPSDEWFLENYPGLRKRPKK